MRFADSLFRTCLGSACVALASSCAILSGPETKSNPAPAQTPPAAMAKAAPDAKAPATPVQNTAPSSSGAIAQVEPSTDAEVEPPLSAEVQRDFEWARRALIAGKLDDAERGFLALTKSNPELGGAFANLGVVYRHKKKFEESVTALEQAVQANPKRAVYFNQLGISYRMVGQFTKAREAYEKAIGLDPNYALAILNLGILYDVYLWDGRRALELYDRYLSLSPGGDDKVKKWASDLRNRNQPRSLASRKEEG